MFSSFLLCYLKHAVILYTTRNPQFAFSPHVFLNAVYSALCDFISKQFFVSFSFFFFISFVIPQMEVLDKLVMPFLISLLL